MSTSRDMASLTDEIKWMFVLFKYLMTNEDKDPGALHQVPMNFEFTIDKDMQMVKAWISELWYEGKMVGRGKSTVSEDEAVDAFQ
ncbi:hypothetical protein EW145_g7684 [Phellinidium pouzarii]|uniref:Uncharacterized protein n=1 Tax=Phellinidium pouzarii TaxID=167371 RepID=A0A4S4KFV2_9AGAM|nr:hypothetical protein EW145_g7684 [Phellinidium pouzarii]